MLGNSLQVSGKGSSALTAPLKKHVVTAAETNKVSGSRHEADKNNLKNKSSTAKTGAIMGPSRQTLDMSHLSVPPATVIQQPRPSLSTLPRSKTSSGDAQRGSRPILTGFPVPKQSLPDIVTSHRPSNSISTRPNEKSQRKLTVEKLTPTTTSDVIRRSRVSTAEELKVEPMEDLSDEEHEEKKGHEFRQLRGFSQQQQQQQQQPLSILSRNYKDIKKRVMVVDKSSSEMDQEEESSIPNFEEEELENESDFESDAYETEEEAEEESELEGNEGHSLNNNGQSGGIDFMIPDLPVITNLINRDKRPTFSSIHGRDEEEIVVKGRQEEWSNQMFRHIQMQSFGDLLEAKARRPKRLDAYCLGRGILQTKLDTVNPMPPSRPQLKEFEVMGYSNFLDKIEELEEEIRNSNEQIICVFTASWVRDKKTWSEDCNLIEAAIAFLCRYLEPSGYLLFVRTGTQKSWKDPANPFKTDRMIMLKALPTIKVWNTEKRIAGSRLYHLDNITVMLED